MDWHLQKEHQLLWLVFDLERMNKVIAGPKERWRSNQLAYFGCLLILVYEEIADV